VSKHIPYKSTLGTGLIDEKFKTMRHSSQINRDSDTIPQTEMMMVLTNKIQWIDVQFEICRSLTLTPPFPRPIVIRDTVSLDLSKARRCLSRAPRFNPENYSA
jgi:hypothetical protein